MEIYIQSRLLEAARESWEIFGEQLRKDALQGRMLDIVRTRLHALQEASFLLARLRIAERYHSHI